jgi:hypothetical protein
VTALLFVVGADHSVRCFFIARALCLLLGSPPASHRVRLVWGCFWCSSWSLGRMSRRGAGFRVLPDCRHVCSRGWLLSVLNHAVRCFVIARAPCLLLSPPPPPPPSSSRSVGLWVFRVWSLGRMSRRGTGFRRTSYRIVVFICDRAVVCCRCRSLCSLFCGCSCAVPAPVIPPHS